MPFIFKKYMFLVLQRYEKRIIYASIRPFWTLEALAFPNVFSEGTIISYKFEE